MLKWVYETEHPVDDVPVVGEDGKIYLPGPSGLHAIGPDGMLQWTSATGTSTPAIDTSGTIYAAGGNYLYAVNPDGTLKWTFKAGDVISSSPAIGLDGAVYVGSHDSSFYAVNSNGTLKWSYKTGNWVDSPAAIGPDGTIYVGADDGNLHAFSPGGVLKWRFPTSPDMSSGPVIGAEGTIYSGEDGSLYALNPDGSLQWKYSEGGNQPSLDFQGAIYMSSSPPGLRAFFLDGTVKWTYYDTWLKWQMAIGTDGMIYVASNDRSTDTTYSYLHAIGSDGQLKWKYELGPVRVDSSPIIGGEGLIYIGTEEGLYAIGDATDTSRPEKVSIPESYALLENYPNPFNPATTISYELPEAARVTLEVFDPFGRKVRVLADQQQPAGWHQVSFDGSGLPSGLYFYRLQAGSFSETRSMMLVK